MRTAIAILTGCLFLFTMSPAASAKSPFRWLRELAQRVLALEERVDGLQDDVTATQEDVSNLDTRVTALEQVPPMGGSVVVDANAQKIGPVIDLGRDGAVVLVEIDGIITRLTVAETEIFAGHCNRSVYFESSDCGGAALISIFSIAPAPGGFWASHSAARFQGKETRFIYRFQGLR